MIRCFLQHALPAFSTDESIMSFVLRLFLLLIRHSESGQCLHICIEALIKLELRLWFWFIILLLILHIIRGLQCDLVRNNLNWSCVRNAWLIGTLAIIKVEIWCSLYTILGVRYSKQAVFSFITLLHLEKDIWILHHWSFLLIYFLEGCTWLVIIHGFLVYTINSAFMLLCLWRWAHQGKFLIFLLILWQCRHLLDIEI